MTGYPAINLNPYNMYQNWGYNYSYPAFRGVQNNPQPVSAPQENVNFRAKSAKSPEQSSQKDAVEKKGMSAGGKIALGAVALTGAAALIDVVACKGKHIKNILGMTDDVAGKAVSQTKNSAQQATQNPALKTQAEKIAKRIKHLEKKLNIDAKPQLQRDYMFDEFKKFPLSIMPDSLAAKTESKHIIAKTGEEVRIIADPLTKKRQVFRGDKMITEAGYDKVGSLSYVRNFDELGREIEALKRGRIYTKSYDGNSKTTKNFINNRLDTVSLEKINENGSRTVVNAEMNSCGKFAELDILTYRPNEKLPDKGVSVMYSGGDISQIGVVKSKKYNGKYQTSEKFIARFINGEARKVSKTKVNPDFTEVVEKFEAALS